MAKLDNQAQADLLAEQARIVARLAEITAILNADNVPAVKNTSDGKQTFPKDFDRKAYCIGLIWRNPAISTRELAKKIGVAKSTLFLPSWSDVAAVLHARKNLSLGGYKDHHINDDLEDSYEQDQ